MPKFTTLESVVAAPLRKANVDTDCIIPKQFLKTIKRTGLGKSAFFELRYEDDGETERSDFVLNKPAYRSSEILIALDNFGCGSSREHAPWALNDFGIKCIVAPSFADIFFNNCFKNGMLPISLPKDKVEMLMVDAEAGKKITVNLPDQKIIRDSGEAIPFEVDAFRKHCLVNGLDDIGLTMQKADIIEKFETQRSETFPWLDGPRSEGTEVRVTSAKTANFYANVARAFIQGQDATDERPARPPSSKVAFSATGSAIDRAVRAAHELEASGEATISRLRTDFVASAGGAVTSGLRAPRLVITMLATPKPVKLEATSGGAQKGGACDKGAGSGGGATDW